MLKRLTFLAASLFMASILLLGAASADTLGISETPPPADFTPAGDGDVNLGLVFALTSGITVDALGFYDIQSLLALDGQLPLTADQTVGIYDSSGNLLTSAIVSLSDPNVGGYFYQSITPITLGPGTYTVDEYATQAWFFSSAAPTTAPGVTFDYQDYVYDNTGLEFPTNTGSSAGIYDGPTFFIATPEPSTLLLISVGLFGVVATRKLALASRP